MKIWFGILIVSLLCGCASTLEYAYETEESKRLLAEALDDVQPESGLIMLQLSDEMQVAISNRIDTSWSKKRKLRELREFLYGADELAINYDAASTKTAIETYNSRRGNCLALANLFVASARHVGLDARFQTVEVRPTWDQSGGTLIRYEHIVATGKIPGENYILDFLPGFTLEGRSSEIISDEAALALYYNNLGAESIVEGQMEASIFNLRKALALSPENSDIWNNFGAAMRRTGQKELAEFSYRRSLLADSHNYSALSNLEHFYHAEDRVAEGDLIKKRADTYRRRNPYYYYFVAVGAFKGGYKEEAIDILKHAIRMEPDEPMFHQALAQAYGAIGDQEGLQKELLLAQQSRESQCIHASDRDEYNRLTVRKN